MPQLETSTFLSQMFWLIICFFSLWFMMSWFIIPRIEDIIEQRRQKIDNYIKKAEQTNNKALQSLEKYEQSVNKAKQEADKIIIANQQALSQTLSNKQAEIEQILNQKIADNEYILAKEKQETVAAMQEVSLQLAYHILDKLEINDIDENKLKEISLTKE